jgi:transcription termination/antitermination protein NusA
MVKIRYTQELMGIMALFSRITRVLVKDCFEDDFKVLTFVVDHSSLGKAIGKKASTIKKLETLLKRKIRIIGFHREVEQYVKNVVYPLRVASVEKMDGILTIKDGDKKTKSLLIGRNAQNLRNTEAIVQRYFTDIKEIKVV